VDAISDAEYITLRAKIDAYDTAAIAIMKAGKRNWIGPDDAANLPPSPSNEERSAAEVYEFCANPPDKYFAYIKEVNGYAREMTTWPGEYLGAVSQGPKYKSNMGDVRVPITVMGVNGKEYYGTYYKSSGDYCRITMKKNKKEAN
jgi:hypothetical protein